MECARKKPFKVYVSLLLVRIFNLIFIFYHSTFDYNVLFVQKKMNKPQFLTVPYQRDMLYFPK